MRSGLKLFKGTEYEYIALHNWVRKHLGEPNECWNCGTTEDRRYHWANVSNEYKKDLSDWKRLCVPCHSRLNGPGSTTTCMKGHEYTKENTYIKPDNRRVCRTCRNVNLRRFRQGLAAPRKVEQNQ